VDVQEQVTASALRAKYAGQGMSEAELSTLEANISVKIPPIYRTLLRLVGNNPYAIAALVGSGWNGRDLLNPIETIQQATLELLDRNGAFEHFPEDGFVLLMHQGYSFLYIEAGKGDDSPVFTGEETDEPFRPPRVCQETLHTMMMEIAPELWAEATQLHQLERLNQRP